MLAKYLLRIVASLFKAEYVTKKLNLIDMYGRVAENQSTDESKKMLMEIDVRPGQHARMRFAMECKFLGFKYDKKNINIYMGKKFTRD